MDCGCLCTVYHARALILHRDTEVAQKVFAALPVKEREVSKTHTVQSWRFDSLVTLAQLDFISD